MKMHEADRRWPEAPKGGRMFNPRNLAVFLFIIAVIWAAKRWLFPLV